MALICRTSAVTEDGIQYLGVDVDTSVWHRVVRSCQHFQDTRQKQYHIYNIQYFLCEARLFSQKKWDSDYKIGEIEKGLNACRIFLVVEQDFGKEAVAYLAFKRAGQIYTTVSLTPPALIALFDSACL